MSKVAFRSKQLDFHKPVPIYWSGELVELTDPSVVTRATPFIPSGMEKEEESEQHLQWALSTQEKFGTTADSVIPIPEIEPLSKDEYEQLYKHEFKITKHLIRIQTFGAEQEYPEYDLDLEDEQWLKEIGPKFDLTPLQFESMIDRLEKGCGQQVVQLAEAKALLKEDDDLTTLVYDYWLAKRLRLHHSLVLHVKTDKRDGVSINDPYVAFRRRAEKMQTRKNRKSDELSYERMVKLRRDCGKLVTLLELIRRREKSKKELIQLAREIFGKRYELDDFDGRVALEAEAQRMKDRRPAYMTPKFLQRHPESTKMSGLAGSGMEYRPQKRHLTSSQENHRVNKRQRMRENGLIPASAIPDDMQLSHLRQISKAEHVAASSATATMVESCALDLVGMPKLANVPVPDGQFAFKRMAGAAYLAPHPFKDRHPPNRCNDSDVRRLHQARHGRRARFCLTSLHTDSSISPSSFPTPNPSAETIDNRQHRCEPASSACVGFARLRRGRGGASRVIIDRGPTTPWSDTINLISDWHSESPFAGQLAQLYKNYIQNNSITHFSQHKCAVPSSPSQSAKTGRGVPLFPPPPPLTAAVNCNSNGVVSCQQPLSAVVSTSTSATTAITALANCNQQLLRPHTPTVIKAASSNCSHHHQLVFPTPTISLLPASTSAASSSSSPNITITTSATTNKQLPVISQTLPIAVDSP